MRAFIFPGQGSQAVGMGQALAAASATAREVFQEVDEALGQHLFKLMTEGPADELTLTENAQPAIMANAIATLRVLEREGGTTFIPIHGTDEIADVTGAGDTVIGAFTLALACGAAALDAARIANVAGGLVVMKRGTATVSRAELREAVGGPR